MKNPEQLKALIRNTAKDKNISAQIIMQNYMLERLLERISLSKYNSNFILKGGFLVAAMVGIDTRATVDLDATIHGLPITETALLQIFTEICDVKVNDNITFRVKNAKTIRMHDDYGGIRIMFEALYPPMKIPLKIDITTGDKITPKEVSYEFQLLFEPRKIKVLAYNLETVLAEKLETIISRGDQNTRSRDFYDVYILNKLQWQNVDISTLKTALITTATKRNTKHIMNRYKQILQTIIESDALNEHWSAYQKSFNYAKDINLIDICNIIGRIMSQIISTN